MSEVAGDVCENCRRLIGKLETPRVHDGHVVCAECEARLKTAPPVSWLFFLVPLGILLLVIRLLRRRSDRRG